MLGKSRSVREHAAQNHSTAQHERDVVLKYCRCAGPEPCACKAPCWCASAASAATAPFHGRTLKIQAIRLWAARQAQNASQVPLPRAARHTK